ncbi:MAG: sulfatase [Verrucomicrobiaceae bacterium]|nr:sulfatase [Verrucomicrobiaceae bacterium]
MRSFICFTLLLAASACAAERPNILWFTFEDSSPHLGCYGDKNANTPNLDALAEKGMKYSRAWSNAPVCAPARTCIISGRWAPSDGAEHMRSEVPMPKGHQMYPQLLRSAGYYCTNNSKEDYNLTKPDGVWDESSGNAHWKKRQAGQPFFAIFNSTKSHESQIRARPHTLIHDPAKVEVPAYHPDTPEVRHDWAQHFDNVTTIDEHFGRTMAELEREGLKDDTIVFAYADHGTGMPRSKRWTYNSGLQVPFIVWFPEKWKHLAPKEYQTGGTSARLISFIDLAPTLVSLVGIQPPEYMQGRAFAGKHATDARKYAFGFRGRMDERYDMMRSVTDGRYVYIRHFYPHLPCAQHVNYMFEQATTQVWHQLFTQGKLNEAQAYPWKPKVSEELYDLETDQWEVNNLASNSQHEAKLKEMRSALSDWMAEIRDLGLIPEAQRIKEAAGGSPKDFYSSNDTFPVQTVLDAALQATDRTQSAPESAVESPYAAVRFWGVQGMLMRGETNPSVSKLLEDSSSAVSTTAAELLASKGDAEQKASAWKVLLANANPSTESAAAATAALNAITHLPHDDIARHKEELSKVPTEAAPGDPGRIREYPARLQDYLGKAFDYSRSKAPKNGKKGRGKKKKAE